MIARMTCSGTEERATLRSASIRWKRAVWCAALAVSTLVGLVRLSAAQPTEAKAKVPHWARLKPSNGFTVRYIYLIVKPAAGAPESAKKGESTPSGLREMAAGSGLTLGPTLEEYLKVLKKQGGDGFDFFVAAAGSVAIGEDGTGAFASGPHNDPYHTSVQDSFTIKRTSPTTVKLRSKGQFAWARTHSGGYDTMAKTWAGAEIREVPLGLTYHQGIVTQSDGIRFLYAYSILPGKPDEADTAPQEGK